SCNCRFHSVIWFGCTSNCCASSASVRSPLTAASATFALNAAECVRRVLFVISSVPLPALSLAQASAKPLIRLSEFARPPLAIGVQYSVELQLLTFYPNLGEIFSIASP